MVRGLENRAAASEGRALLRELPPPGMAKELHSIVEPAMNALSVNTGSSEKGETSAGQNEYSKYILTDDPARYLLRKTPPYNTITLTLLTLALIS